jgi:hypothetical protein
VIHAEFDRYLSTRGPDAADRARAETQRVLDETFGIAPDFPYPNRDEPDRFDEDWNRVATGSPRDESESESAPRD